MRTIWSFSRMRTKQRPAVPLVQRAGARAYLAADSGASVTIVDIQDDRGRRRVNELGSRTAYVHPDVSREPEVQAALSATGMAS